MERPLPMIMPRANPFTCLTCQTVTCLPLQRSLECSHALGIKVCKMGNRNDHLQQATEKDSYASLRSIASLQRNR